MADGTYGGSSDTSLDKIATDDLTGGSFSAQKAQVVKLGIGADGDMELVDLTHPVPVALDAPTLAALETITVANPTTNPETGLAKEAGGNLATIAASLSVLDDWDETDRAKVVLPRAATPTLANVAASASSVTLLAANAARLGAAIVNDSTSILYVKFGSTASATSFTVCLAGSVAGVPAYYEVPFGYVGIITGIWVSATGAARVTEVAA